MFENLKKSSSQQVNSYPQEQYQKTIKDIDWEREKLQKSMNEIDDRLNRLDIEIRKLISIKQKDKAKLKIREMKIYQKKIEKQQNQYNTFTTMKIQLEASQTDNCITQAIEIFGDFSKQQIKINEQLQDIMNDYGDMQQAQEQQNQLWREIQNTGQDQQEIDEEYSKYCEEEQVPKQKQEQIDPFQKIETGKIQQFVPLSQTSTNATQSSKSIDSNNLSELQFNKSRSLQIQFIQPKQNQLDDQDVMFD